jgi:hypothetical protein
LAANSGPELPDPGTTGSITKEQQEQLGLQAAAEVYKQMPVLPDSSPSAQYIKRVGRKLVSVIPQEYSWRYDFHVIPEKEINAFALPGGPMFVNIGAITAADDEAQLAGVMAHEMAHVYMQHSAKQASKQALTQGILGVLGAVVGSGTAGNLARLGMQIGAGAVSLKYSRSDTTSRIGSGSAGTSATPTDVHNYNCQNYDGQRSDNSREPALHTSPLSRSRRGCYSFVPGFRSNGTITVLLLPSFSREPSCPRSNVLVTPLPTTTSASVASKSSTRLRTKLSCPEFLL